MKKLIKFPLYILLLGLVLVMAVIYVYYFTTLPENEINNWLKSLTEKRANLEISFQKVNRDIWNHLVIEGIEIAPSTGAETPIATISKLDLEYNILDLINGKYHFNSIKLDSLDARMPDGGFKFLSGQQGATSGQSRLSLSVNNILINSARIAINDSDMVFIDSLKSSLSLKDSLLNFNLDHFAARWPTRNINLQSLSGKILSEGNGFRLDSVDARFGATRLLLWGNTGKSLTKNLDLHYKFNPVNFEDITKITGVHLVGNLMAEGTLRGAINDFGGEISIDGTFLGKPFEKVTSLYSFADKVLKFDSLSGVIVKSQIDGSARFNFGAKPEEYSFLGSVKNLDLREIGPKLKTSFSGDVHLEGRGFKEQTFTMSLDANLDSVVIDSYYFDQVTGPVQFDLKRINFLPGLQGRYKNTYINVQGNLEYLGNLDITGNVEFDDLTNFTNQIFLKELGGKGKAAFHATGPTADFDVTGSFVSDSCWTYGLFPGQIEINANLRSFISHRVGDVNGRWTGGLLYSLATDSGYFRTTVSGEKAFFDSVSVMGPVGFVAMKGQYDGTLFPPIFRADTVYGQAAGNIFYSRMPIVLNVRENETEFAHFIIGLGLGSIQLVGSVSNNLDLNMNVYASEFQIEPIVSRFYHDKKISGKWLGSASLRGNFENPLIDFNLQIDSLAVNDTLLGNLKAILTYRNGYIHTDSSNIASPYGNYLFSGDLPIDLSFGEVQNRFPEKPINFMMTASGNRLILSEIFIPSVERFQTDFKLAVSLSGTYSKPIISGWGNLEDGELKVLDLVNPLTNVRAYFRMDNTTIYVDSATAVPVGGKKWISSFGGLISDRRSKKTVDLVRASGTMKLISLGNFEYNLNVSGHNVFFISDTYEISGLADADLRVLGDTIPTVTGNIVLKRLEIRDEFSKFIPPDYDSTIVAEDSSIWNLDLHISAINNLWIKNSDVDAEMKGDLYVTRQVGIMNTLGSLDFIRGTYNLLGQKFNVESGSMQFNKVAVINPDLDFLVTTRLRYQSSTSGVAGAQLSPIELHITGTLAAPSIDVGTGSTLTREDLLRFLITKNQVTPSSQSNFTKNLVTSVLPTISNFIPEINIPGVFEELSFYQTDKNTTGISVAKYISRSLYVRFSQELTTSHPAGSTIGIEYYLNNNLSFNVTRGVQEQQGNEGISFDINLNFEY
jgi:hypothetical protein